MATSTFERKIEIKDAESAKRLLEILQDDAPAKILSHTPFSDKERDRSERLLKNCLSRSKH